MDAIGALVVIAVVLAFGLLCARFGMAYLTNARHRAPRGQFLPWWYIGGQPDIPVPPADEDGTEEPGRPTGPRARRSLAGTAGTASSARAGKERVES